MKQGAKYGNVDTKYISTALEPTKFYPAVSFVTTICMNARIVSGTAAL